jgi:hypothetical protein
MRKSRKSKVKSEWPEAIATAILCISLAIMVFSVSKCTYETSKANAEACEGRVSCVF